MAYKHAPTTKEMQEMRQLIPDKIPFTPLQTVSLLLGGSGGTGQRLRPSFPRTMASVASLTLGAARTACCRF